MRESILISKTLSIERFEGEEMTYYEFMSDCGCNDFGEQRPIKEKSVCYCDNEWELNRNYLDYIW